MIGTTISHYRILEELGRGGMGVVYKAHDIKLDRFVALKFLPHQLTANDAEKARFLQEARAAAALNHPNVCSVFDIQEHDGQQFIVMECVEGTTLRSRLPFQDAQLAGQCAIQIGEALSEAHAKGIVHRDVKSENIMITAKHHVKVMDFGLAKLKGSLKLTRTSSTVGTLAYMAPEQIQGGEVDARSDIFSYGIVFFEMLTGKMPFNGEHDAAMMYSIVNEEPASLLKFRPDLSAEYDRIIRRALEKDPEDRYQSIADMVSELRKEQKKTGRVSRILPDQPTGMAASEPVSADPATSPKRRKSPMFIVAGIAVLLLAGFVAYYFLADRQQAIDSLAVLPFENVGSTPDKEYLADGLTESVINNLTKISSLRVIPRSTAFRFKGKELDIQEIGSKLKVSAVLSGRITQRGEMLDIQVDLIDIKRESQLWGNRYQSSVADLLALQEQITNDVSAKLGIGLTIETREKLAHRSTENTQAYQLYLQGRYYWNKRTAITIDRAVGYFNQAIALDSSYALAYSGLADCYIIQSQYAGIPTGITIPLTQAAARRALALDNSLAEAHTTLAFSYFEEWKYDDAEREFTQALSLNPRYATTYHWYGLMLSRLGNNDRYLSMIQKAQEIDPYSPVITLNVGIANFLSGRTDEALSNLKKSTEIDPSFASGFGWLGNVYFRQKNFGDALPNFLKALELSGRSSESLGNLGNFYGSTGNREKAMKLLHENEERYRTGTGAAYNTARIYAGLGEKEKALQWLEKDYEDRSTFINSLLIDFYWDGLRSDPRFIALTRKVGLVK